MLGQQPVQPQRRRLLRHLVQRRISLAKGHDTFVWNNRQQIAESPHTALINAHRRCPPLLPEVPQRTGIRAIFGHWPTRRVDRLHTPALRRARAPRVLHLEEIVARAASKIALSFPSGDPFVASGASKDM